MAANIALRAFLTRIGINTMTQDAIEEQGITDMASLLELTVKDVRYMENSVMKYVAPLVTPGAIQLPFRALKQQEAAQYWITTRCWMG
jgi:hypothetical protein